MLGCKQVGHIAKFCPQKAKDAGTENTAATAAAAATTTINNKQPNKEEQGPGQVQSKTNDPEGWTEVARRKKKSPKSGDSIPATISPVKTAKEPTKKPATKPSESLRPTSKQSTTPAPTPESPKPAAPSKKEKKITQEPMETTVNLKRRRESGKGASKKCVKKNTLLRQAPPLKPNLQLHCNQHLHYHLHHHHHHPLHKMYNPHNKWTFPPPNKNLTPQNRLLHTNYFLKKPIPTKSPSQDPNRPKEPKQKALLAPHPFPL